MAKIKYGERTLAEITTGQSVTLHLEGREMKHDIEIEGFASGGTGSGGSDTPSGDMICTLVDPTSIGGFAFSSRKELATVNLPNATIIGQSAFSGCTALTSIDLPNVSSVGEAAFEGCTALTSANLPNAISIGRMTFKDCNALTYVDLPKAVDIGDSAFWHCTSLATLIIRNPEKACNIFVTAALDTKILTDEGVPTGEGFIYVPTAFYEEYVENLIREAVAIFGLDEATAEYIARATFRKIEDYPEILGK